MIQDGILLKMCHCDGETCISTHFFERSNLNFHEVNLLNLPVVAKSGLAIKIPIVMELFFMLHDIKLPQQISQI